ncbi:MAG: domain S-box protein [Proteobacteria bacterium]|nr:domain S-box protein [Pseudomonadota bacterium]
MIDSEQNPARAATHRHAAADVFAHLPDATFIVDREARIVDANPAASALLGYTKDELVEMYPWDFVTSASREEILDLTHHLPPHEVSTVQRTYHRRDGAELTIALRLNRAPLCGRDLIIVSCRDITEQKRLEARLRRSEARLAEGQRLTKTGIWELDFKTGETDWSVETCRIFGFPPAPPSPHYSAFRERVLPDDREAVDRGLRESFESGEPRPLKYVFVMPDGTRKHIETIAQPVVDGEGRSVKLMGTVMDVTDRVLAAEALHSSEYSMRRVLDTIPGLVWSASANGEVEYHNQRWTEYTGLTVAQANGQGWQQAVAPGDLPALVRRWRELLASGVAGEAEARLRRHDGSYRWYLFRGVPLRDDDGNVVKWFGMNTDIEERKSAEFLLSGEKRVLEMIARGRPLSEVFGTLCAIVESLSGDCRCAVTLLDPGGTPQPSRVDRVGDCARPGSVPLPPNELLVQASTRNDLLCIENIAADERWAGDAWISGGLNACWIFPIRSSRDESIGAFVVYSPTTGEPTPQHGKMIEQIARLAAVVIEREQAEAQLKRSEATLSTAQFLSATGSFNWLPGRSEMSWSPEMYRICGISPTLRPDLDLLRRLIDPDDLTRLRGSVDHTRQSIRIECRLRRPDGAVRHLEIVANALRDAEGLALEWTGAVMDVTEQRHSQEAMRSAKARFEGILAIADDAIIATDKQRRISLFNHGAEKVFGYAAAEIIGQSLDRLLPPRFHARHAAHLQAFAQSADVARGMAERREVVGLRKDGSEFPAEASISRLDLAGEQVFTVILRDISDRKCAAEALRAAVQLARGQVEALTRTVDALAAESAPDRIAEHVLRTITSQLGALGCSLWRRDEASGLVAFETAFEHGRLVTPGDPEAAVSPALRVDDVWPWPEVFRTGKPYLLPDIRQEPPFPWRDRVIAMGVISILVVPMSVAGQVEGVIGIRFGSRRAFSHDEMDLAQALANLAMLAIQLTRMAMQSRSAAVLAERNRLARDIHDTLAQGFTGVIVQLEAAADASSKQLAREANEHLGRAAEVARESLKEARRSVLALRPQALEGSNLCQALASLIHKMTAGTPLRAEFSVSGTVPVLPAQWEENLLRIGQEVLTNTQRHARAGHFVAQLVFNAQGLELNLSDDGQGFDPQRRHDGFGLRGIRERVEGMGGEIHIDSRAGAGSSIRISLPHTAQGAEK